MGHETASDASSIMGMEEGTSTPEPEMVLELDTRISIRERFGLKELHIVILLQENS